MSLSLSLSRPGTISSAVSSSTGSFFQDFFIHKKEVMPGFLHPREDSSSISSST
jgi:hypothetical protein